MPPAGLRAAAVPVLMATALMLHTVASHPDHVDALMPPHASANDKAAALRTERVLGLAAGLIQGSGGTARTANQGGGGGDGGTITGNGAAQTHRRRPRRSIRLDDGGAIQAPCPPPGVDALLTSLFAGTTATKLRPQERYSSVDCVREPDQAARCLFSNVAVGPAGVTFYEDPANPLSFIGPAVKYEFPASYFGLRGGTDGAHYVTVTKHTGPIPDDAEYADTEFAYLMVPFWPQNQGHWLVDDLLASFSNMLELGVYVSNPLLVIAKGCIDYFNGQPANIAYCHDFYLNRTSGFTADPPIFLTENPHPPGSQAHARNARLAAAYTRNTLFFQNVMGGHSTFAMLNRGAKRSLHWHLFRGRFLAKAGFVEPTLTRHQVTLVRKHGRRTILNFDDVVAASRALGVDVVVYDPTVQSWPDQVRMLLSTTVLVTPPGGISFPAAFLPPASVGLFIDGWDHAAGASYPLEGYWWESLAAFRFLSYNYGAAEAVFPEAATNVSALTHRMKVGAGLPLDREVTPADMTPEATRLLYQFYTDVRVDLHRYRQVLCEALAIAEHARRWEGGYDVRRCRLWRRETGGG